MSIELENQFFGAFIAFWIVKILEKITPGVSYKEKILPILLLLLCVIIIVTLLRYSLYSATENIPSRMAAHVINLTCSASIGFVLWAFNPKLFFDPFEGLTLASVLMCTILAWIVVGEISRFMPPEIVSLEQEYYRSA